jgi:hypothetical protein
MAQPSSRQTLKDYCLRRLGHPVIKINVDDGQVEDRLDDALQFFSEYHFDGVERMYFPYPVTAQDITNKYINTDSISPSIITITRVFPFSEMGMSATNFFSARYQMHLQDYFGLRNGSFNLSYYSIAQQYISLVQQYLEPEKAFTFSRVTNKLRLDTNWSETMLAGNFLMIEAYVVLNPNTYTEIYNDRLLKEYLTNLIKRQWGQNLIKFANVDLPGGIHFDAQKIHDDAQIQIDKIEEQVQQKYELPPDFMVG